jgi:small subunit ribosomal protein S19e
MLGEVKPQDMIEELAVELREKKIVQAPEWSNFVKTGISKQRPPVRNDWWFVRSAAVFRSVANLGPIGVSKLRTKYGGKQNRGYRPEHFRKGSGKIIRIILQQLESAELIKQVVINGRKGRSITRKGKSLLKSVAGKVKR